MRSPTYIVTLYIAGDVTSAMGVIRSRAYSVGQCVTVTPTAFIYTGGEETGMAIGFVQYPRFPKPEMKILDLARSTAMALLPVLNQRSALLVASDVTEWITVNPPGRSLGESDV